MPIFEYKCLECDHEFEKLVMGPAGNEISCPVCGSRDVSRLLSVFGMKSGDSFQSSSGNSGCGSCSGGSCATCH